jgi:hypothetical protein
MILKIIVTAKIISKSQSFFFHWYLQNIEIQNLPYINIIYNTHLINSRLLWKQMFFTLICVWVYNWIVSHFHLHLSYNTWNIEVMTDLKVTQFFFISWHGDKQSIRKTNVVSSNTESLSVCPLRVSGFLRVLRFLPPIKLTATI